MRETIGFGIDLGTTNSVIADSDAGTVTVIKNNDGWDYTPSAVWMPKPGVLHVGARARQRAATNPDDAVVEFKLSMGLADAEHRFANAGVALSPPQLSAEVLKSLCADATHHLGTAPTAAVITVPAAFALNQNNATSEAAALAGLGTQCPLIQEPTAAAFAYGLADASDRAYWMIFDFGGGTFDAAVVSKRDGELTVLDHAGDSHLGGKLIDVAVVDRLLAPAVERALGFAEFRRENPRWRNQFGRLKIAAEDAKIALSRQDSVPLYVDLPDDRGGTEQFEYTLTRAELDDVAAPLYDKAITLCRRALAEGGLGPADIDRLLLVGGTTLAPGLRERLADPRHGLGIALDHSQDPTTVVARGAAIFAGTVPLPRTAAAPRPGAYTAELTYPPTTSATEVTVGGRLRAAGPVDWTSFVIVLEDTTVRPEYRSGRIAVTADGAFLSTVPIEPGGSARITVVLTGPTGTRQELSPDTMTIRHVDTEVGPAVLTQSLGISLADRRFAPLLAKGTPLPATARETFRTSAALRRGDATRVLRIPVVEGEQGRADRNRQVAVLEIRPVDVTTDIPVGSDVDVTIRVDASRRISVVADLPVGTAQVDADVDLDNVRAPDPAELERRLREIEQRKARLESDTEAIGSADARHLLDDLDERRGIDEVAQDVRVAPVGTAEAAQAEQRLRDMQIELDRVEDAVELPRLLAEIRDELDECADLVERMGEPEDRRQLDDLRRRADDLARAPDAAAARALLDRARRFGSGLFRRDPLAEVHVFAWHKQNRHRLAPADRVDALIREGERALDAGDVRLLAGVNQRLRRLRPDDAGTDIGVLPWGGA